MNVQRVFRHNVLSIKRKRINWELNEPYLQTERTSNSEIKSFSSYGLHFYENFGWYSWYSLLSIPDVSSCSDLVFEWVSWITKGSSIEYDIVHVRPDNLWKNQKSICNSSVGTNSVASASAAAALTPTAPYQAHKARY